MPTNGITLGAADSDLKWKEAGVRCSVDLHRFRSSTGRLVLLGSRGMYSQRNAGSGIHNVAKMRKFGCSKHKEAESLRKGGHQ